MHETPLAFECKVEMVFSIMDDICFNPSGRWESSHLYTSFVLSRPGTPWIKQRGPATIRRSSDSSQPLAQTDLRWSMARGTHSNQPELEPPDESSELWRTVSVCSGYSRCENGGRDDLWRVRRTRFAQRSPSRLDLQ